VIHVVFRAAAEGACLFVQWYLYSFQVNEYFECIRYPCPKIVECYISRPKEKTIFLYVMFGVGALCLFINIVEILYLLWKRCSRRKVKALPPPSDSTDSKRPSAPPLNMRVVYRDPEHAPPGYYIPDVDPPTERYRCPANGFPHIRMRAASFTTSESDITDDSLSSMGSVRNLMQENMRTYNV